MKEKKLLLTYTTKNYYNVAPICPPYSPPSQHWPIQSPPYMLVLYKFGYPPYDYSTDTIYKNEAQATEKKPVMCFCTQLTKK